jgi:hypothetical protein
MMIMDSGSIQFLFFLSHFKPIFKARESVPG